MFTLGFRYWGGTLVRSTHNTNLRKISRIAAEHVASGATDVWIECRGVTIFDYRKA